MVQLNLVVDAYDLWKQVVMTDLLAKSKLDILNKDQIPDSLYLTFCVFSIDPKNVDEI